MKTYMLLGVVVMALLLVPVAQAGEFEFEELNAELKLNHQWYQTEEDSVFQDIDLSAKLTLSANWYEADVDDCQPLWWQPIPKLQPLGAGQTFHAKLEVPEISINDFSARDWRPSLNVQPLALPAIETQRLRISYDYYKDC